MKFYGHAIASLVFLLFYPLFGNVVFIPMLSSIFADIDHIYMLFKEKSFTWKKIKSLFRDSGLNVDGLSSEVKKNRWKGILFLFHTVEFNILLLFMALFYPVLIYISIGFIFHMFTDYVHHSIKGLPLSRWLFFTEFLRGT